MGGSSPRSWPNRREGVYHVFFFFFWHPCQKSTDHRYLGLFLDSYIYCIGLYISHSILSTLVLHRWKQFQRHNQRILCILKGPSEPKSILPMHVGSHHNFVDKTSSSCGSNSTCDDAVKLHRYTEHVFLGSFSSSGDRFHLLITSTSLCPLGS